MASRKQNLKSLFSNARTRIIILFTLVLLLTAVVIGYLKLQGAGFTGTQAAAEVGVTPQITAVPGAPDPTVQYAKLQEQQNVSQAVQAAKKGGSAIPTIIRTQAVGAGVEVVGPPGGVGFEALSREEAGGAQQSLWIQNVQQANCSKEAVTKAVNQGAQLEDLKQACTCVQLKALGYNAQELQTVCSCNELRAAGFSARELKDAGFSAGRLRTCGFDACELRNAGLTAQQMKDGGFPDGELRGAGYSPSEIAAAGLPSGITDDDVRKAGCSAEALERLRKAGVSASAIRRISGCSATQMKAAGYSAKELANAGFTAAELKKAGFSPEELKNAGFSTRDLLNARLAPNELENAGITSSQIQAAGPAPARIKAAENIPDCTVASLQKAKAEGVSALTVRQTLGCSASQLKAAGYTAKDLKDAGFTAAELKDAGFSAKDLKDAGFNSAELKNAGVSAKDMRDAGLTAQQIKDAGYTPSDLRNAGFTADQLKAAGFDDAALRKAGFTIPETTVAGLAAPPTPAVPPSDVAAPPAPAQPTAAQAVAVQQKHLQDIMERQEDIASEQKNQQAIQQKTAAMLSAANQNLQAWQQVASHVYVSGTPPPEKKGAGAEGAEAGAGTRAAGAGSAASNAQTKAIFKAGDVIYAVLDTSINSDQPGPILATIVSGKFKGAKLIGSFNVPTNSDEMVISFHTLSVPSAARTTTISAYAIDPNTARTAIATRANHHYLLRYGSLFASSFIEGFGNAFQSANTSIQIGGTGGGDNITVSQGVGRSTLENAVIGLATVGKTWGQHVQQLFSRPTTVEVCSGTGMGILFTQDLTSL